MDCFYHVISVAIPAHHYYVAELNDIQILMGNYNCTVIWCFVDRYLAQQTFFNIVCFSMIKSTSVNQNLET